MENLSPKIYQTPEEFEEFKRLYPDYSVPEDTIVIQVTFIDGKTHVEMMRHNH